MKRSNHWLISVGELSGDLLGADLVHELKAAAPDLKFSGIVGPSLIAEGVNAVASINELNVMGVSEVLKKLASISMLKRRILEYVDRNEIKVAILVDFAGFHLQLAEELKLRGVYVIQYVAPKLWAWGRHRISKLRENVDLLLATFPFEEEYFRKEGINCHYIKCPIAIRTESIQANKKDLGFDDNKVVFAFLPGSRIQEVHRLVPPMLSIAKKVKKLLPEAEFIIPIASSLRNSKSRKMMLQHKQESVYFVERNSLEVMSAADAALVASGTATLECALLMTPLAVIYSMNPFSYFLAKKKVQIPWASLVNILKSKFLVREYLQHFDESKVAEELVSLARNEEKRASMLKEFAELRRDLIELKSTSAITHIFNALKMNHVTS